MTRDNRRRRLWIALAALVLAAASPFLDTRAPGLGTLNASAATSCQTPANCPPGNVVFRDPGDDASDPINGQEDALDLLAGGFAYDPAFNQLKIYLVVKDPGNTCAGGCGYAGGNTNVISPYYEYEMRWTYQGTNWFVYTLVDNTGIPFAGPGGLLTCGAGTWDAAGNETVLGSSLPGCAIQTSCKPGIVEMDINASDVGIKAPPTGLLQKPTGLSIERPQYVTNTGALNPPGVTIDQDASKGSYDLSTPNPTVQQSPSANCPSPPPSPSPSPTPPPRVPPVFHTDRTGFTHEAAIDPQRLASDPPIAYDTTGGLYVGAIDGLSTGRSYVWKSEDGGAQFDLLRCYDPTATLPLQERASCTRGGGGADVATGTSQPPQAPGSLNPPNPPAAYYIDTNDQATLSCASSYNGGNSFQVSGPTVQNPVGMGQACNVGTNGSLIPTTASRPWLAVYRGKGGVPVDTVYALYDRSGAGPGLLRSPDAGGSYSNRTVTSACAANCSSLSATSSNAVGIDTINPGNIAVDQVTGTLYAFSSTNNAVSGRYAVEVSAAPDPSTNSGTIAFQTVVIPGSESSASTANHYVAGGVDGAGNVYAVWATAASPGRAQQTIYYSHSTDSGAVRGKTWSRPIAITGPGGALPRVTAGFAPSVVAGDAGRVDIAFYGTEHPEPFNPASDSADWYVYFVQTLDGLASSPTFRPALPTPGSDSLVPGRATQAPVHRNNICNTNPCTPGVSDGNLGNMLQVQLSPTGAADISFVDDNNSAQSAQSGAPIVSHVVQAMGRSVYASAAGGTGFVENPGLPLSESFDIRPQVDDAQGDAPYPGHGPNGPGPNSDAFDILAVKFHPVDTKTLDITMSFKVPPARTGLPGGPLCSVFVVLFPPSSCTMRFDYIVGWHFSNDYYVAGFGSDYSNVCIPIVNVSPGPQCPSPYAAFAGKPVPISGPAGPLGFQYRLSNGLNTQVPFVFSPKDRPNDIDLLVPYSAIGGPHKGDLLRSAQGFSFIQLWAATPTQADLDTFETQVDGTAPFDYSVGNQSAALVPTVATMTASPRPAPIVDAVLPQLPPTQRFPVEWVWWALGAGVSLPIGWRSVSWARRRRRTNS